MTASLIEHPIFGFESPGDPDKWVFHYTSLASAEAISGSLTFRLSLMSTMNDPREFRPPEPMLVSTTDSGSGVALAERRRAIQMLNERRLNVRAAAFTLDADDGRPNSIPRTNGRGYARPTMWAHYGDNHRGVCLAVNRNVLVEALTEKFGPYALCASVAYVVGVDPDDWSRYLSLDELSDMGTETAVDKHFRDHIMRLLFEKNVDWQAEREWRCCIDGQASTGIVDIAISPEMVAGIVLGVDFPEADLARVEPIARALSAVDSVARGYLHQMNVIDVLPVKTDASPWRSLTNAELASLGYLGGGPDD